MTAFGLSGPYADWLAPNIVSYAAGGQHYLTGDPDREPLQNGGYQALYQAGTWAFGATLAAMWHARADGPSASRQKSRAWRCRPRSWSSTCPTSHTGSRRRCSTRRGNIASALVGIYPAIDGHIGIHAMPKNWPQLVDAMDGQWLAEDERFVDNRARLRNNDDLMAADVRLVGGRHEARRLRARR